MSVEQSDAEIETGRGPSISRRTLLKSGAGVATAAAVSSGQLPEPVDPVGEVEAITPQWTAIAVGSVAGAYVADWVIGGDDEADPNDVLEDEIFAVASSVAEGREAFASEIQTLWVDTPQGESPFANAAWQRIRAIVVENAVAGETESTAESEALTAIQNQATVSVVNLAERWNTAVDALIEEIVLDVENSVGVLDTTSTISGYGSSSVPQGWTEVSAGTTTGGSVLISETGVTLPGSLPDGETPVSDRSILGISTTISSAPDVTAPAGSDVSAWVEGTAGGTGTSSSHMLVTATHSSLGSTDVADITLYYLALSRIKTEFDNITSSLSTYVSSVYDQIEEGAMDPADILGPQDIVSSFQGSDKQSRMAAEMLAIGMEVPSDYGYEAKISHPDLSTDLWGSLFLKSSSSIEPEPGMTIAAADYDIAYFGFFSENTGNFETRVFDGSSDLQILDVRGVEGEDSVAGESFGESADDSSDVVVFEGEDPPEPIEFPQDHSDWSVVIDGATNRSTHSPTEISKDGTTYTVPSTSLNAGEAVEGVRLVPPITYSAPVTHVSDPTNPDDGDTQAQLEELREQVDLIQTEFNDSGGGGFNIGGWLGSLANLGQYAVAAGLAGIVLFIALLSSFASLGRPDRGRE